MCNITHWCQINTFWNAIPLRSADEFYSSFVPRFYWSSLIDTSNSQWIFMAKRSYSIWFFTIISGCYCIILCHFTSAERHNTAFDMHCELQICMRWIQSIPVLYIHTPVHWLLVEWSQWSSILTSGLRMRVCVCVIMMRARVIPSTPHNYRLPLPPPPAIQITKHLRNDHVHMCDVWPTVIGSITRCYRATYFYFVCDIRLYCVHYAPIVCNCGLLYHTRVKSRDPIYLRDDHAQRIFDLIFTSIHTYKYIYHRHTQTHAHGSNTIVAGILENEKKNGIREPYQRGIMHTNATMPHGSDRIQYDYVVSIFTFLLIQLHTGGIHWHMNRITHSHTYAHTFTNLLAQFENISLFYI